jgi:hypothetical protein
VSACADFSLAFGVVTIIAVLLGLALYRTGRALDYADKQLDELRKYTAQLRESGWESRP